MRIAQALQRMVTDLFTIPPVIDGHRLEIHNRLKLLLEEDGAAATASSWTDGCRVIPFRHNTKIKQKNKGK